MTSGTTPSQAPVVEPGQDIVLVITKPPLRATVHRRIHDVTQRRS